MVQQDRRIVIVGGGVGGLRLSRMLSARKLASVTLIAQAPTSTYYAALYRVACGGGEEESVLPIEAALADERVKILVDAAATIDVAKRTVTCASGAVVPYDDLVLAVGSDVAFFGIPGMQESAFTLKSTADAHRLHAHLHEVLAESVTPQRRSYSHAFPLPEDEITPIVIVGAGPTGIELAGELATCAPSIAAAHGLHPQALKIILIEAMPSLLPAVPKTMSDRILRRLRSIGVDVRLDCPIVSYDGVDLETKTGGLHATTVVWTAGVKPSALLETIAGLERDKRGRIVVDDYLRAKNTDDVYAIGDAAATPHAGYAQTAVADADYLANLLSLKSSGRASGKHVQRRPAVAIPVGGRWAAVGIFGLRFYGRIGWLMRRVADLHAFSLLLPLGLALSTWRARKRTRYDCEHCGKR